MQHYVDAIRSCGSADGFSSESPERLHIDYAKSAYRATNKKKNIKQMTKWLTCQENCHRFTAYLQWSSPGYVLDPGSSDLADNADDEEIPGKDDNAGEVDLGYFVAKHPAYPDTPVASVIDNFGATDFLPCVEQFLCRSSPQPETILIPNLNSRIDAFKCLTIEIPPAPQVNKSVTRDVVRARCSEPACGMSNGLSAQFDTVLA
jgi:hypothetical protein